VRLCIYIFHTFIQIYITIQAKTTQSCSLKNSNTVHALIPAEQDINNLQQLKCDSMQQLESMDNLYPDIAHAWSFCALILMLLVNAIRWGAYLHFSFINVQGQINSFLSIHVLLPNRIIPSGACYGNVLIKEIVFCKQIVPSF
jgi:hypothetical protein